MGLNTSQYQSIMRTYEQKQARSRDLMNAHYKEVYQKSPEFQALDESISALSVSYGKRLLNGDDKAVDSLKEELAILRSSKQELLKSCGFPADYLEPVYECSDCQDTGYIGSQKCHCFKKAVCSLLYEQSNLKEILQKENFDTFQLDYYPLNYLETKSNHSYPARAMMADTLDVCKEFVRTFPEKHGNLFLYGDVGVGKTFLSNCIARELIEQGFSVIYFSAPSLFNILAQSAFDKGSANSKEMQEYIYDCDLLIIDDLGTEFTNNFVVSQLFSCINERLLNKKSTVISTNLSLDTLADLYTERSFSRITSNYTMLKLLGDDIRLKKKLRKREDHYDSQK